MRFLEQRAIHRRERKKNICEEKKTRKTDADAQQASVTTTKQRKLTKSSIITFALVPVQEEARNQSAKIRTKQHAFRF